MRMGRDRVIANAPQTSRLTIDRRCRFREIDPRASTVIGPGSAFPPFILRWSIAANGHLYSQIPHYPFLATAGTVERRRA